MLILVLNFFLKKMKRWPTTRSLMNSEPERSDGQTAEAESSPVSFLTRSNIREQKASLLRVLEKHTRISSPWFNIPHRHSPFWRGTKDLICRWRDSLPNYYASAKLVSNRWIRFKVKSTDWKVRPKNCTSV